MYPEVKAIVKTLLLNYHHNWDKEAFLVNVSERALILEKNPLVKARLTPTQNHYQAYSIFLRIKKPKTEMKKTDKKEVNHSERAHALLSASGASRCAHRARQT